MERVIFLDRDGTINEEVNYLYRPKDLRLLPGVPQALRMLKEHGFRIVVVSNQAGVARGYYAEADVDALHGHLNKILRQQGAEIDYFFFCPHHPEYGIGAYRRQCHCRKPETGLLEMAELYCNVDKMHSWMIGDKLIDIEAGNRYGVHSALVGTGYGRRVHIEQMEKGEQLYDIYAETLADAARAIIEREASDSM